MESKTTRSLTSSRLKIFKVEALTILCFITLPYLALPSFAESENKESIQTTVRVTLNSTKMRSAPKFLAPIVAELKYGDELTATNSENGWYSVKNNRGKGYIHQSAITTKQIVLNRDPRSGVPLQVDPSEVVLAGKGFNSETEGDYAATGGQVDFNAVNKMEKISVSDKDLSRFITQGKLNQ